ncbi:MAG: S1 RNA-binding domain-containing protein, partial [Rhodospirillaceae bacterium]|nr:S1 RNA-binding domain-containing protein [Rhodospirillaceae bacterium]
MTEIGTIPGANEDFAALLEESFAQNANLEGSVLTGRIVSLASDFALVDVGLKSEGRVPLKEFGHKAEVKVGDTIEVFVDRYEDRDGLVVLSREKARREESWNELEKAFEGNQRVNGVIFGRV